MMEEVRLKGLAKRITEIIRRRHPWFPIDAYVDITYAMNVRTESYIACAKYIRTLQKHYPDYNNTFDRDDNTPRLLDMIVLLRALTEYENELVFCEL
jgi:hypothetical protein